MNHSFIHYPRNNKWVGLVPKSAQGSMCAEEWISAFQGQHTLHKGLKPEAARKLYIQYAKILPLFGCAFFPCCKEQPPAGLFEVRIENFVVGVNNTHLHIVDKKKKVGNSYSKSI